MIMKITKIHQHIFEKNIVAIQYKSAEELIVLLHDESVLKHHIQKNETKNIFTLKTSMKYADGGFDIDSPCSIYALDDIVVVSNDKKTHAIIHYPDKYTIRIQREDYHANISKFPIALYKNEAQIPHLIYATAWNRVDILNLENCYNLTSDKSLIEDRAEENHAKYANTEQYGYHIWPSQFDYFYADLKVSPNQKHFLSKGWAWGSCDSFYVFYIEEFISNKRIKTIDVGGFEHQGRAACWISNNEIIVCCNAVFEELDDADEKNPIEIVRYQLKGEKFEITKRTKVPDLKEEDFEFIFSKTLQAIIAYPKDVAGLLIFDLDGNTIFNKQHYKIEHFNPENLTFSTIEKNELSIYKIELS